MTSKLFLLSIHCFPVLFASLKQVIMRGTDCVVINYELCKILRVDVAWLKKPERPMEDF